MSDDETGAFFVAALIAVGGLGFILVPLLCVRLIREWWGRWVLGACLLAMLVILLLVLMCFSAKDVRTDPAYVGLFMTCGAAVQTLTLGGAILCGVSWRDDAVERRNPAAVVAICGSLIGSGLIFTGSNIGEGDTIWSTLGPAAVALIAWFFLWICMEAAGSFSEAITIERDACTGLRFGGTLATMGLILGRANVGDWHGDEEFFATFVHIGWPTLVLAMIAISLQRLWQPRPGEQRSLLFHGLMPAILMSIGSLIWVLAQGRLR